MDACTHRQIPPLPTAPTLPSPLLTMGQASPPPHSPLPASAMLGTFGNLRKPSELHVICILRPRSLTFPIVFHTSTFREPRIHDGSLPCSPGEALGTRCCHSASKDAHVKPSMYITHITYGSFRFKSLKCTKSCTLKCANRWTHTNF